MRPLGVALLTIGMVSLSGHGGNGESPTAQGTSSGATTPQETNLPPDVYADSLSRLPLIQREQMDEDGKKVYDLFVSPQTRTLAGLQGPYGIWLHSPKLGESLLAANQYLRFHTDLDRRLTELAILVTARELDHQFEWTAHEPAALRDGLEQSIIDIVKYRRDATGLGEKETLIIRLGRELFRQKKVSSQTYAEAVRLFGKRGVVNLSALMANYAMIGLMLNTFDQQLRPDQKPLLPMP